MENIILILPGTIALGDEIGIYRIFLLEMLSMNKINENSPILCGKDRTFLYENIFTNVFCMEDYSVEKIKEQMGREYTTVSIFPEIFYHPCEAWSFGGGYGASLDKNIITTKPNIFGYEKKNYYNSKNHSNQFKKLVTNIKFLDKLPKFNNENFIVYHHRIKKDGTWDSKMKTLQIFLDSLQTKKIVIFSQKDLSYEHPNLYITKNLQEYATFLNSERCLAVFSVWSGGGQFASYCCRKNTKLFMYFDDMQCQKVDDKLQKYIDSEMAFDFAQFTDVQRKFIKEEDIK